MRAIAAFFALLLLGLAPSTAMAQPAAEQINRFDVLVQVERNGDIVVTETIDLTSLGQEIRRGIFRDLPRYFERDGVRYATSYDVLGVRRDGEDEPYDTDTEDNAFRIIIGDEDVLLENGPHRYELRYRVANQVRYFADYDEIYWNATGNYWSFPIERARATIVLPQGARVTQTAAYTGPLGASGRDFTYRVEGMRHVFESSRPFAEGEGLTVAVGFAKGAVDPPSAADEGALWWQRYGALGLLLASFAGLFVFLYRGWDRVGRDPAKGPVFPRYEAPRGYSPAGVHYIYHRGVQGHRALIATLMNLAVKGRLEIDASEKKQTTLTERATGPSPDVTDEDRALEARIFASGPTKTLGKAVDTGFTSAYSQFQASLARHYGSAYFRWNIAYTLFALVLSAIVVVFVVAQTVNWTLWHTIGIVLLALMNIAFMYFMPSATPKGQQVRTEIEGFKLYLETAEKLQLNAVQPGSEAPPPMTTERYEKFLPYAVALGVEEPWTKHFERLIPEEAARYQPRWSSGHYSAGSFAGISSALVANMSSGVSSAMPSSSGSGSGGGGSSGGGGGGGGGGGW